MTRKDVERRRAKAAARLDVELQAERDRLLAEVADCLSPDCCCHQQQWQQLETVRYLLISEELSL